MTSTISPLASNVPIVDENRWPTPYFQRLLATWLKEKAAAETAAITLTSLGGDPGADRLIRWNDTTNTFQFITLSQAIDLVGSAAQGDILYRNGTVWTRLPAGTSGQFLKTLGTGANPLWGTPTSGSGLFSALLSATPTAAITGLSTLVGTGAATSDTSAGQRLTGTSGQAGAYTTSVPATPYSITALLASNNSGSVAGIGWTDTTKYQLFYSNPGVSFASLGQMNVQNNSAFTVYASTAGTGGNNYPLKLIWMKIRDDGTNVTYSVSTDGVNFATVYTVAKASGYLGATGYSRIFVGPVNGGGANDTVIMSWTQGT